MALGFLRIIQVIVVRQRVMFFSKNPSEQILGRMCRKWNGIKYFMAPKDQNIHCDMNVHRKKCMQNRVNNLKRISALYCYLFSYYRSKGVYLTLKCFSEKIWQISQHLGHIERIYKNIRKRILAKYSNTVFSTVLKTK